MLVGQQLGPFAIEKELGAGAMGAVYLGRYVKTGARVAIKVMMPGLATEQATARFEREAAILKQFNHPNIVKIYGLGKSSGTRYYAMEYIEGESLEKVLARRGRYSWEQVVTLGQQLCAALQHAHEQGIVHRDLKPSNLMILADGTLKLTDFGIAKDLDVTGITGTNCTVGTAAYMSPEQCRGERNITHKSDLYSLGIVFYELVTGKKPFNATNPMDMFLQHVKAKFERPSRIILDLPVWLDTVICQLLEKKPDQRPRDAAMVYAALGSVKEKVEAQRSAGVDAVRARILGGDTTAPKLDETDKEASRLLMTGKSRAKKRRKVIPFFRKGWFVLMALIGLMSGMGGLVYLLARPPSPETLYQQAAQLMKTGSADDRQTAREVIAKFQRIYATRTDAQAKEMNDWADAIDIEYADSRLAKRLERSLDKKPWLGEPDEYEEQGFKAAKAEEAGDLEEAAKYWQDLHKKVGPMPWGLLAAKRLKQIKDVEDYDQKGQDYFLDMKRSGREPKLEGPEREALAAYRCEHFADLYMGTNDLALAQRRWDEMKERYRKEPKQRYWYLLAAHRWYLLKVRVPSTTDPDAARKELVLQALDAAKALEKETLTEARLICLQIIAIYDKEPGLKDLVEEAGKILKKVNNKLGA